MKVLRTLTFPAMCTAFALAGCGDPTAPLPIEGAPHELEFEIAGWGVGATKWLLRGDTLVYRVTTEDFTSATETRTIPSAEEWRAFWIEMQRTGLNQWRKRYVAEGIADGEGWNTRVRIGNVLIESQGSNAYPDERGREHELQRTAAFEAFLAALRRLSGVADQ